MVQATVYAVCAGVQATIDAIALALDTIAFAVQTLFDVFGGSAMFRVIKEVFMVDTAPWVNPVDSSR